MKKAFDCVAMKDDVQRRLLKQMAGLSAGQRRAAIQQALENSHSPIGDLWRALGRGKSAPAALVAEERGAYKVKNQDV